MKVDVSCSVGGKTIKFETGELAKQTDGSCLASTDGTVVFAAAVEGEAREGGDFLPLTVDYREQASAAGKFPGGFYKREGRPSQKEVLTARLIDRPLRPTRGDERPQVELPLEILDDPRLEMPDESTTCGEVPERGVALVDFYI